MRTEAEITADARPGTAFSNHSEFEVWAKRHCYECVNDVPEKDVFCPILGVALVTEKTPREWTSTEPDEHGCTAIDTCTEFVQRPEWPGDDDPDAGPPPPDPAPECDGQLDIVDAFLPAALAELEKAPVGAYLGRSS